MAAILEPANESLAFCVGSSSVITCSSPMAFLLRWRLTTNSGSSSSTELKVYINSTSLQDVAMIGDFVVRLESKNPLVSTTTLDEVDPKHNGTVLICMTFTPLGSEEFVQTTVLIVKGNWLDKQLVTAICYLSNPCMPFSIMESCFPDPPAVPLHPELFAQSVSSAVLAWIPPAELMCVSSYIITLINITEGNTLYTFNTTTNTTNLTVSDLTQGVEYSFAVAAVDAGGRVGEKSVLAEAITLDSKLINVDCCCTYKRSLNTKS